MLLLYYLLKALEDRVEKENISVLLNMCSVSVIVLCLARVDTSVVLTTV